MATRGGSRVIDLTGSDDDEDVPLSKRAFAAQQRAQKPTVARQQIDLCGSSESPVPPEPHEGSSSQLKGKVRIHATDKFAQSGHVSTTSSKDRPPPTSSNLLQGRSSHDDTRPRQEGGFGHPHNSAIAKSGATKRSQRESHAVSKSPRRLPSMAQGSTSSIYAGRAKRPRENSTSDRPSPLKRSRLDGQSSRTFPDKLFNGPSNRDGRAKAEIVDLSEESIVSSPEHRTLKKPSQQSATDVQRASDSVRSPKLAASAGRNFLKSYEKDSVRFKAEEGSRDISRAGDLSQKPHASPAQRRDPRSNEKGTVNAPQDRAEQRNGSEVPESELGSPRQAGKPTFRSSPTAASEKGNGTSALSSRRIFSISFENARRVSREKTSATPSNQSARETQSPLAASSHISTAASPAGEAAARHRAPPVKRAPPLKGSEHSSQISKPAAETRGARKKQISLNRPQQRAFPLSPSATSNEGCGGQDRDAAVESMEEPLKAPQIEPQETPKKGNASSLDRLEIPESADQLRESTATKFADDTSSTDEPLAQRGRSDDGRRAKHDGSPSALRRTSHDVSRQAAGAQGVDLSPRLKPHRELPFEPKACRDHQHSRDHQKAVQPTRHEKVASSGAPTGRKVANSDECVSSADHNVTDGLHLTSSCQIKRVVERSVNEAHEDNEYWTHSMLKKARGMQQNARIARDESTDVFSKMQPVSAEETTVKSSKFSVEIARQKSKKQRHWTASSIEYQTETNALPNYSQYVSIKGNFLANNDITLQHYPYFGDDFDIANAGGLSTQYALDVDDRQRKLLCLAKAENLASYAEDMLRAIRCQWPDVLYVLLDPKPDIGSDIDAIAALNRRDKEWCTEDLARSSGRWLTLLSRISRSPDPATAGRAVLFCEHFHKLAKLQPWHVARMSDYVRGLLQRDKNALTDDELTCRVCMRFGCPYHGEIEEIALDAENSELGSQSSVDSEHVVRTDIINPPDVNDRARIGFPSSVSDDDEGIPPVRRTLRYWQTGKDVQSIQTKNDERGPFYPCDHPGESCSSAECSCFELRIPCEKSCSCPKSCSRKFQGCDCKYKSGQKSVCFESENCVCFQLGRECDPDLCGDCGVCDVLDPCNRDDDRILQRNCRNANIQRGVRKHTILGDSGVHGLGLYACENLREHDFLGEYLGEIVTKEEAERRGAVYEHQKLSYLFSLNTTQEIDATHFGNKIRFINHAMKSKVNLYPRIQLVNTVHRIALYAARHIKAGEELFFDYGPQFPSEQLGGRTGKKMAQQSQSKATPHVRNSLLLKDWHDIEEKTDELGNKRACKGGKLDWKASGAAKQRQIYEHVPQDDEEDGEDEQQGAYDINRYNIVDDTDIEDAAGGDVGGDGMPEEEEEFVPDDEQDEEPLRLRYSRRRR